MRLLLKTALALASALSLGSAAASPTHTLNIEFENAALARNFNGGENFTESGFNLTAVDHNAPGTGLVGAGVSNSTCEYAICPSRSSSYYGVLNDGSLKMEAGSGSMLRLAGFDAGFIAPTPDESLKGMIGKLLVTGQSAAGATIASFDLQGQLDDGTTSFGHFSFDTAFSSMQFSSVSFAACLYDFDGNCDPRNSFNLAQFGIDSIEVIPEPASYALVGLALIAAGGVTRRRRASL